MLGISSRISIGLMEGVGVGEGGCGIFGFQKSPGDSNVWFELEALFWGFP